MQVFHNTPSLGYIAWQDVHIQYKGVTYGIPDGNTDKRFVIWRYADPDCFYGSDEFPTLGPEDLLVFLNKNGVYSIVPKTQIVDGSLIVSDSIMTDALAANSVTTEKIAAGAITADLIAASAVGAGAIAAGAVTADEIAAGAIATAHLAALAVTADKIAANAVSADKIAANAVGAEKIAAGAITAEKLSIGVAEGMTGPIDADDRPISALDNQIWLDSTGLKMKNVDSPHVMMHLDASRLGFWDPHGDPSIGIGDVADMATALGSDMEYGLLLAQGEIRATEAVIRKSLAQGLVGQKHIEEGSVTLRKLSNLVSVTIPDRFMLAKHTSLDPAVESLTNPGFETGNRSGWTGTGTVQGTGARTGTYCVKNPNLYQECATWPGQTWQGYAYWYSDYSRTAIVELIFLDSTGAVLDTVTTSDTKVFSSWTKLTVSGTAPEGAAKVRFRVRYSGTADIWVDDCSCIGSCVHADGTIVLDHTIPASEAVEQIWITAGGGGARTVLINGDVRATAISAMTGLKMDVREDDGDLQVQVVVAGYVTAGAYKLYQNQRLPLRGAEPNYAVTITEASGGGGTCDTPCQTACQSSCLAGCQDVCETNCQSVCQAECMYACQTTCQDACQDSCQSACEQTSQGGGCWVAGTPVTVYLPESETATEMPVEQLVPGMQMPYYDPATDTLAITECLSNARSYTHTIYVAEVEGGWTLEMTGEQPMDVLRAHLVTGQIMWHRVQARYLRAGDKLIRPFDKTMHEILAVREESRTKTWVWNPRTAARAYIAHGFADAISKT